MIKELGKGLFMRIFFITVLLFFLTITSVYAQDDSDSNDHSNEIMPEIILKPELHFPQMAVKAGLQVNIFVEVFIGIDGKPYRTEIVKREPEFVYLFDNEVRKWAMQIRFSPALKDDEPVESQIIVPVKFKLENFQPPQIKEEPKPVYPSEAIEMGMDGWVALAVLVNPQGLPEGTINIVSRYPIYSDIFDKAAIEVAKNTTFIPAFTNGLSSYGWIFMKVKFNIRNK